MSGAAASAAEPFLRLQGVEKRFGSSTVLADVTLDIEDHEFLCLLGPSGCGKTTLLRILCGIESASAGRILRRGEDIAAWPPAARRFGVVFQSYALFPNLSALENVAYGLRGMGRERVKARCREMLDLVDLAAHADKVPAQLSGGQQQRVALARALAPNPDLLLLDEPLSALDAQVRATLRAEIRRLQQQLHVPTVMVTHDQDEALAIADRVVLMNDGRIVQDASPQALYARPASPFVARFVGRMNLWPARRLDAARVAVGQAEFECGPGAASGAENEIRLGIRPEAVELLPRDGSAMPWRKGGAGGNTLAATIDGVVFCGAHVVLNLDAPALAQPLEVVCATPPGGELPWHPGDRVHAHLPSGALILVPA